MTCDNKGWTDWRNEWPDPTISPFWWVWQPGDLNPHFQIWPTDPKFIAHRKQKKPRPDVEWYLPMFPPAPPDPASPKGRP